MSAADLMLRELMARRGYSENAAELDLARDAFAAGFDLARPIAPGFAETIAGALESLAACGIELAGDRRVVIRAALELAYRAGAAHERDACAAIAVELGDDEAEVRIRERGAP